MNDTTKPRVCISPLATRPVLYTDTVGGVQTCRDDLWAVTTAELNALKPAPPTIVQNLLHWALGELLAALPDRRDWFNPDAEKVLRAIHSGPRIAGADLDLRDLGHLFAESQETGRPVTLSASACGLLLAAMTTAPERPTCPTCGTHEVELSRTCHNSACASYAAPATTYEGWKQPPAGAAA
jgi:predicted RNA-binding Zn-ribbon protein involved in translation (DUF1610 family)